MSKNRSLLLNFLSFFFLIYGTFAMDYAVYQDNASWIFWICYVGLIMMGFGIWFRYARVIISQLYILTIPVVIWLVDFGSRLLTGTHWFGTTEYFFGDLLPGARLVSLEHFIILPLGYLALWLVGGKIRGAWIISLAEVTLLYVIGRLWSEAGQNVNCVFNSCFPYVPDDQWYPLRWFLLIFGMIGLTWLVLTLILSFLKRQGYNKNIS